MSDVHPPSLFSTRPLVQICARTSEAPAEAREIPVRGSGQDRAMWALATRDRYGFESLLLAPLGLHACPGWTGRLEAGTVAGVVARLQGFRTRKFSWKVAFDEAELAARLSVLGLELSRNSTQVVALEPDYDRVAARYERECRRRVRLSRMRGVTVRASSGPDDVRAYYDVHLRLARRKAYEHVYPLELFLELVSLPETCLLLAEWEGRVLGGALHFRDGDMLLGWHAAMDRERSALQPMCALYDERVRIGCATGARCLNLGRSLGLTSLERFKSAWGARVESNWQFTWRSPFWRAAEGVRRAFRVGPGNASYETWFHAWQNGRPRVLL